MKKTLRVEAFLRDMNTVVPWERLEKRILYAYPSSAEYSLTMMLRIYCLQQWYNLSDPAMEEALYDRFSFQRFVGLDGFADKVPDESTILRFRHLLESHHLSDVILAETNTYLAEKGLILKSGTIMDATILEAPTSKKNQDKRRDPEMSSTKKNNKWHFGAKGHIGVQAEGKPLVHSIAYTTAKTNDGKVQDQLCHGQEKALFADSAYVSKERKRKARESGVYYGVSDKGAYKHPLSSSQKKRNRKHASLRAKVEHPFRVMKVLWGHAKLRYKGLAKNACQFTILCALSNLFFSRKQLLAQCA